MSIEFALFVEGVNEELLFCVLLHRLGLSKFTIEKIDGGVSKLASAKPRMDRRRNEGKRIAVVLDADQDAQATLNEFEAEKKRLDLPVDRVFLVPDNRSPGSIETILEAMAPERHRRIHECFTQYRECLKEISPEYVLPKPKARIFAYCEAVGNGPKERNRDFRVAAHWNLDAPALSPLKAFLRECANTDPIDETA